MNRTVVSVFAAVSLRAFLFAGCSASEDGPASTPSTADGGDGLDGAATTDDDAAAPTACSSRQRLHRLARLRHDGAQVHDALHRRLVRERMLQREGLLHAGHGE